MFYANLVTRNWESYRAQAKPPGCRRVAQGLVCRGEVANGRAQFSGGANRVANGALHRCGEISSAPIRDLILLSRAGAAPHLLEAW